jgi:alanine racemase
MIRPTVARVDLAAVESNLHALATFLSDLPASPLEPGTSDLAPPASPPAPRIIAVVKANAYGHGASEAGLALERAGAAMLACADIEEGIVLRRAGVRIPILVFGALGISDLDGVFEFDLTPTISTPTAAQNLVAASLRRSAVSAKQASQPLRCHLKIDTGMNRLGFRHDNLARTMPEIARSEQLVIDAVYTHFATADEPEHPAFDLQRERFEQALAMLPALGITPRLRHAANSAALLRDQRVWYDFVRPGLLLYGIVPPPLAATLPLRPALSLHSRIVHVKGIRAGEGNGYGLKSVMDRPSTIAIVPAGYADGLDRRMATRTFMLVRGTRVPVVGSVCMDMTTIDVTGLDVHTGDDVVIVGQQGEEEIGVREIAASIGTIPYELLCRLQIHGWAMGDCRLTDWRLTTVDQLISGGGGFQSALIHRQFVNRESAIRRSAIVSLQSVNLQSAIGNRQ